MYVHFPSSQHVVGTKKYLNLAKHRSWMGHRFSGLRQFPLKNISKIRLVFRERVKKRYVASVNNSIYIEQSPKIPRAKYKNASKCYILRLKTILLIDFRKSE